MKGQCQTYPQSAQDIQETNEHSKRFSLEEEAKGWTGHLLPPKEKEEEEGTDLTL